MGMTRIGRRNSGGRQSQWLANCGSVSHTKRCYEGLWTRKKPGSLNQYSFRTLPSPAENIHPRDQLTSSSTLGDNLPLKGYHDSEVVGHCSCSSGFLTAPSRCVDRLVRKKKVLVELEKKVSFAWSLNRIRFLELFWRPGPFCSFKARACRWNLVLFFPTTGPREKKPSWRGGVDTVWIFPSGESV